MRIGKVSAAADVTPQATQQIQARGVWHRPNVTGTETDLAGICNVLDTFRKTGINLVFLETFYHGMTVFRSSMVPYYTGFDKFDYSPYPDYLTAFVAEAGKRGIEVHAWVEDFYIGVNENYFTRNLSDWLMRTADGSVRQSEGRDYGGYLFLDAANPEVRTYLIRFYDELLTKVPGIAGLNLDYIRYPVSNRSDDTGYTEVAMNGFAGAEGFAFPDGATFEEKVKTVASHYNEWVTYRAEQITTFVGGVFDMVKSRHAGVLLSTAVFPEQGKSFGDKKQDFTTWLRRGYLDIITPMAYYDDTATLKNALTQMLGDLGGCYCYAGISPTFHNLSDEQVLSQIKTCADAGADGFVFFGSQSILNQPGYIDLLDRTYSGEETALLPHAEPKALFDLTASKVEKKLTDAGEDKEKIAALRTELGNISEMAERGDTASAEAARKQLRLLVRYNLSAYVSGVNLDTVREDLERLYRFTEIRAARLGIKYPAGGDDGKETETSAGSETESSGNGTGAAEEAVTEPETTPGNGGKEPGKRFSLIPVIGAGIAVAALFTAGVAYALASKKRGGKPGGKE